MCYNRALLLRATLDWVDEGQLCMKCGEPVDEEEAFVAGTYFPESQNATGPQSFVPYAPVMPYVLCEACCGIIENDGDLPIVEVNKTIDGLLETAMLESEWVPVRVFVRQIMTQFSLN